MKTLVERISRRVMLVELPEFQSASAANVLLAMTDKLRDDIAQPMRLSRAYDRGREMMVHKALSQCTGIACTVYGSEAPTRT